MELSNRSEWTRPFLGLTAVLLLWVAVFQGTAGSAPVPSAVRISDPETNLLFAQVTSDGELQVTGEVSFAGVPEVAVSGTVTTRPASVTTHRQVEFLVAPGESANLTVPGINASLVTVSHADDDRGTITLTSTNFTPAFTIGGESETLPSFVAIPLAQPMFVNSIVLMCHNPVANCRLQVSVVGNPMS